MKKIHGRTYLKVAVFEEFDEGLLLAAHLTNLGFEARVHNDKALQLLWFLCPPHATFRVQVWEDVFQAAIDFLDGGQDVPAVVEKALHCPSCGSVRVEYPQMTRKFILPPCCCISELFFALSNTNVTASIVITSGTCPQKNCDAKERQRGK